MEKQLEELAVMLYEIDAIKFGDFVTKVGLKTPVYVDLRTIISHPKIFVSKLKLYLYIHLYKYEYNLITS